jgi:uncharacterized membrane protein (Fun14 family)
MSEVTIPIVYQLAVGGFGGYLIGYALKKVTKMVAFIIAVILFAIIYLAYSGILNINFDGFTKEVQNALGYSAQAVPSLTPFISNLPLIGSFLLGLFIAYKIA